MDDAETTVETPMRGRVAMLLLHQPESFVRGLGVPIVGQIEHPLVLRRPRTRDQGLKVVFVLIEP